MFEAFLGHDGLDIVGEDFVGAGFLHLIVGDLEVCRTRSNAAFQCDEVVVVGADWAIWGSEWVCKMGLKDRNGVREWK
jgi:hypothetical protein